MARIRYGAMILDLNAMLDEIALDVAARGGGLLYEPLWERRV